MKDMIETIENLTQIACMDGTWNFDPYFHGMANGMILCLAILKNEEPKYLNPPKKWLKDKPKPHDVLTVGEKEDEHKTD